MNSKPYRTAYVTQSTGHSFTPILEYCQNLKFLTTGYEQYDSQEELAKLIRTAMQDYSPEQDVIVPVGAVISSFVIGYLAKEKCEEVGAAFLNIGVYSDKQYNIVQM